MNTEACGRIHLIDASDMRITVGDVCYTIKEGLLQQVIKHFKRGQYVKVEVSPEGEAVAFVNQDKQELYTTIKKKGRA